MATATLQDPPHPISAAPDGPDAYTCQCGHALRFFGGGRHRVYFEPSNDKLDDPIMDRVCPACQRGLPGKRAA